MNRKLIRASAAIVLAFTILMMAMAPKAEPVLNVQASSMALIEYESGKVLYEQNSGTRLPMASTTKIMTALIVLENCEINEIVSIPDEAVGTEGSSIYLCKDEQMTVIDLLYGLMLASGNDAAVALAVHTGGSVEAFVEKMNEKAESLGLTKTHFITPNGLHADKHLTTAYELCMITREALKNETFREIVSTKYYTAESGDKARTFKNKNSLLWTYDGAFGVKTGYTMAAGRCLVFGAERNGMTVIGAVLNCRPMFETAQELMDMAFENFVMETVLRENTPIGKTFVENSGGELLEVLVKESIIAVMQKAERRSFRIETELSPFLSAPIAVGEEVGIIRVYDGDDMIGTSPLIAGNDVRERGFSYWWKVLSAAFA